ncbi:MAG: hypothetical protein HYS27_25780 [Deltaproteobacteria bacterium]|nr:hypothetical protein [Deltaproteobacteria bacterium]
MKNITRTLPLALALLVVAACGKLDRASEAPAAVGEKDAMSQLGPGGGGASLDRPEPMAEEKAMPKKRAAKADKLLDALAAAPSEMAADESKGEGQGASTTPAPTPTRAWFPETMLFAPRVVTDDKGAAALDVPVPDRLTTWRVLALAHSRQGAQAGSVSTFVSDLPVSVDVVVPPYLVAGDRVLLPIQVVNSTDAALTRPLATRVDGGRLTGAPTNVRVDAHGTTTVTTWLEAGAPGSIAVEATVPGEDSVVRSIPVRSAGQPFHVERGGTLAAPRTPTLALPEKVIAGSARVTLTVVPGALALLRAELATASGRSSVDDDAYLLALTGRAPALAAKLNATVEPEAVTRLSRLAGQRLARQAINPDLMVAIKLAPGALRHAPETLIGRNGAHLATMVARAQRPDGTFGGGSGWTVQRVLVTTADGLTALRAGADAQAARAATMRARGAFERFAGQIDDPYTAAAVLATGALDDPLDASLVDELAKKVTDALVARDDGSRALPVPSGVVRADGASPTEVEATALAVLALHDRPSASALLPDLGATLLGAWRPGAGFGDGATNVRAIEAVALLFTQPLPTKVTVTLSKDGKALATTTLEGDKLKEQASVSAPVDVAGGALALQVAADPPVPGLSYVVSVDGAVPWPAPPPDAGLALQAELPTLAVGRASTITLRATAPGGAGLRIEHALPAGVDAVEASLQALVEAGTISSFERPEGKVVMVVPEREQGSAFVARYSVIPSLAGTLQPTASSSEIDGDESTRTYFPPRAWSIAAR